MLATNANELFYERLDRDPKIAPPSRRWSVDPLAATSREVEAIGAESFAKSFDKRRTNRAYTLRTRARTYARERVRTHVSRALIARSKRNEIGHEYVAAGTWTTRAFAFETTSTRTTARESGAAATREPRLPRLASLRAGSEITKAGASRARAFPFRSSTKDVALLRWRG